jgi:SAM-dependent methyltransferase
VKIAEILQELEHLTHFAPLEGERYATCLDAYEAASDQREQILAWFAKDVAPALSSLSSHVLSVGCGAGDLDNEFLAVGAARVSTLNYVGLEPDAQQCARFVEQMGFEDGGSVRVEAHNTRFEDFEAERRFDLVLMVHSLYYMEDPRQALEKACDLVDDDGRLVILIASNDTLNELSSSFWKLEKRQPAWFSEDLSEHLDRFEVPFERERIEATLDVTACCEPGSELGIRIADFLAQVPTGRLPERLRGMIFSYLDETARLDRGKRCLPHNVDAFTITL